MSMKLEVWVRNLLGFFVSLHKALHCVPNNCSVLEDKGFYDVACLMPYSYYCEELVEVYAQRT